MTKRVASRVLLSYAVVGAEGTSQVFGVELAADIEDRAVDAVEASGDVSCLPVAVVGIVLDVLIEQRFLSDGGDALKARPMLEEEVKAVGAGALSI